MLNLSYPDQVYSSQNPPSNETLKEDLSLIEEGHNAIETEVSALQALVMEAVYPVGSIYTAVVPTNPGTLLGVGTWTAFGAGRVIVGHNASDTDFDTAEETGGAKTVTLTAAQSGLPAHPHTVGVKLSSTEATGYGLKVSPDGFTDRVMVSGDSTSTSTVSAANASQAHTNIQPYIVAYMWKRVS